MLKSAKEYLLLSDSVTKLHGAGALVAKGCGKG
jgi:hypothetical protein